MCLVHNKQYTPREGRQIFITMKFQADLQSSAELEAADCPARVSITLRELKEEKELGLELLTGDLDGVIIVMENFLWKNSI